MDVSYLSALFLEECTGCGVGKDFISKSLMGQLERQFASFIRGIDQE